MGYEQMFNGNPPVEQFTDVPSPPETDCYTGEAPGDPGAIPPGFHYEHGGPNTAGVGMGNKTQNDGGL